MVNNEAQNHAGFVSGADTPQCLVGKSGETLTKDRLERGGRWGRQLKQTVKVRIHYYAPTMVGILVSPTLKVKQKEK